MTEPQEVLAEALDDHLPRMAFHKYGQFYTDDPDFDIEAYYQRAAAEMLEALAERGYALVRTPETLDVNGVPVRRRYDLTKDSDPAHDFDGPDPFAASPAPDPGAGLDAAWNGERRCIFAGCVATWRHWHGFLPGGYDNPADPEGVPIIFEGDDPEPNAVRDFNGAALAPPGDGEDPVEEAFAVDLR